MPSTGTPVYLKSAVTDYIRVAIWHPLCGHFWSLQKPAQEALLSTAIIQQLIMSNVYVSAPTIERSNVDMWSHIINIRSIITKIIIMINTAWAEKTEYKFELMCVIYSSVVSSGNNEFWCTLCCTWWCQVIITWVDAITEVSEYVHCIA